MLLTMPTKTLLCPDRSSSITSSWQPTAAEGLSGACSDLDWSFAEIVNDPCTSTTRPEHAASVSALAENDWRTLDAYPPAPGSPRYQPFAERMMVTSPSGKAAAREALAHGNGVQSRQSGREAYRGPALHPSTRSSAQEMQPVLSIAASDTSAVNDKQHDPDMPAEAAVRRLGSFGPWYERTLAAMTNLQPLGSGPLAVDRGADDGRADRRGKAGTQMPAPAPAAAGRLGLAQMLLPSSTHIAPFTGACRSA